tara:strand:+ start:9361 stop:13521 length:4161 start_codon:yes stop_codon:yes gene_type:complete
LSKSCPTNDNNSSVIIENDDLKDEQLENTRLVTDNNKEINKLLSQRFNLGQEITPKELEDFFRQLYPTKSVADKKLLVHSIQALLDANRAVVPMIHDVIRRRIGETKYSGPIVPVETSMFTGEFNIDKDLSFEEQSDLDIDNVNTKDDDLKTFVANNRDEFLENPLNYINKKIKEAQKMIEWNKTRDISQEELRDDIQGWNNTISRLTMVSKRIPDEFKRIVKIANLDEMPTSTLKIIYKRTLGIVNATAKGGVFGNFGGIMLQIKTPRQLRFQDASGAFDVITKGTNRYADNIATRINMFITDTNVLNAEMKKLYGKDWKKDMNVELSMTEINNIIKEMSNGQLLDENNKQITVHSKTPSPKDRLQRIFQGIMKGWVKIGDGVSYVAVSDGRAISEDKYNAARNKSEYMLLEKNELYIFNDYGHIQDEKATKENKFPTFVRHPDGTRVRKFQNLVKLSEFVPPNGVDGSWYVNFSETQLDEIKKITREARKIDDYAHKYMAHHLPRTTQKLLAELSTMFNNKFTESELKHLFFKDFTVTGENTVVRYVDEQKVFIEVTDKDVELINSLKATFGMNIAEELVIPNASKVYTDKAERNMYMSNHWASLYDFERFQTMLGNMISRTQRELREFSETLGLSYDAELGYIPDENKYPKVWRSFRAERQKKAMEHIERLMDKLTSLEKTRNNLAGLVTEDTQLGVTIPLAAQNKYFKRVSGAYDIREARTDDGVYYDYLKNMMGTLERNNLTTDLVKSFRLLNEANIKGDIDNNHRDVVMEVATNLYKVPFATSDLKGPLGMTMKGFTKTLNTWFGRIPFKKTVQKTPEQVQQTLRTVASGLTAMYLSGPGSAITNYTGLFQNIIDYGVEHTQTARNLYNSDKLIPIRDDEGNLVYKDGNIQYSKVTIGQRIKEIVEQSGLVNFNEFFSQSMVNGIAHASIERSIQQNLVAAMMVYHSKRLKGNKTEIAKAETELSQTVGELLQRSDSFMNATELVASEKDRKTDEALETYRARKKQSKKNQWKETVAAFVQFAINKETEFTSVLRKTGNHNILIKKLGAESLADAIKTKGLGVGEQLFNFYADTIKRFNLTMGDTESYVRTISFIIGASRAHRANQLIGGQQMEWYEYKNESEIADTIAWGKEFSNFTNFGLSTQDLGQFNYNGLGNLFGKFKYWSQQKFGRDVRTWKEAYQSVLSFNDITNSNLSVSAMTKMAKQMFTTDMKTLREKNPALAQLKTHALLQGGITLFWDTMIFGLPIPGLASLRAYMFGGKSILGLDSTKAVKSDLLSLMIFPFTLAAKMAMMGDWEDEDFEFTLTYLMRMSFLGYLPMKGYDALVSIMYYMTDNERKAIDKTVDTFQPLLGGRTGPGRVIQPVIKKQFKEIFIEDYGD